MDATHSISDIDAESTQQAINDWNAFRDKAGTLLNGLDLTDIAHDFWLTRNRHGSGFWGGDYEDAVGKVLTEIAHSFAGCDVIVCDDNTLQIV